VTKKKKDLVYGAHFQNYELTAESKLIWTVILIKSKV
jgi:hypothetical protein